MGYIYSGLVRKILCNGAVIIYKYRGWWNYQVLVHLNLACTQMFAPLMIPYSLDAINNDCSVRPCLKVHLCNGAVIIYKYRGWWNYQILVHLNLACTQMFAPLMIPYSLNAINNDCSVRPCLKVHDKMLV